MRKINGGKKLLSALLVLIMLVFSFPAAYAEDISAEIIAEEAVTELSAETAETAGSDQAPVPETEPVQDQEADPEAGQEPIMSQDDPVAEPAPVLPEEVPAETPAEAEVPEEVPTEAPAEAEVPEEVPTETPAETEIPEEVPAEAPAEAGTQEEAPTAEPGDGQEAEEEPAGSEESGEEEVFEFDDDPGTVSEELLEPFNNPEAKEPADFTGTIEIEIKTREICYDQPVTLVARISEEIGISCRLVWEANDGDGRGWYAVGSGLEYTFTLTRDIVNREYRVVLFTVD